jgi:hypothetical protein
MSATRLALVLVFLVAAPSSGFCQILRPFKRLDRAMAEIMPKLAEQAAGELARKGVEKAFENMFEGMGPIFDLAISIDVFAQIQMDPTLLDQEKDARAKGQWIETTTPGVWGYWIGERCTAQLARGGTVYAVDERNVPTTQRIEPPAPLPGAKPLDRSLKDVLTKGAAKQFLSVTDKFAEKLKEEKYSRPVLATMYFEVEEDDLRSFLGDTKHGEISSNTIFKRDGDKFDQNRTISSFYSLRKKDTKQTNPFMAHCSFVFVTVKEGKGALKTLSFDIYLEDLKSEKGKFLGYSWKIKDVQNK